MKQRGLYYIRRPVEEGPLFPAAIELIDVTRQLHQSFNTHWSLLYTLTPTSMRLLRTRHMIPIPLPGAILLPPFLHYVIDTRQSGRHGRHLILDVLWLDPAFMGLVPDPASFLWLFSDPDGELRRMMEAAVEATQSGVDNAYWAVQYAGRQVLETLRNARTQSPGHYRIRSSHTAPTTHTLVSRVLTYLSTHLTQSFTISDLAGHVHVSASTLAHTYKTATGETPMQALRRLRLDHARRLLVTDMKLDTVAEASGFYNATHLARDFKKREGMTPARFRRQITDGAPFPSNGGGRSR